MTDALVDDFDGVLGVDAVITITPPGQGAVAVPVHGIMEWSPPVRTFKTAKYAVQSGAKSKKERVLAGTEQAAHSRITGLFEKAHLEALDGVCGINGCALSMTVAGTVFAGTGAVSTAGVDNITDTKEMTNTVEIDWDAGWTMETAGGQ